MLIIGDVHGLSNFIDLIKTNDIKDEIICQVGDFGIGFSETVEREIVKLKLLDEFLLERDIDLFVIRGNHDYRIYWDPKMGLKLPKFKKLRLINDNSIVNINGKNIFFSGGGTSIDRIVRIPENSHDFYESFYFHKEKVENLIKVLGPVDIVITHTAPDFVSPIKFNGLVENYIKKEDDVRRRSGYDFNLEGSLYSELLFERRRVTELYQLIKTPSLKQWFYGHFHSSNTEKYEDCEFKLLNINEIYEIREI